MLHLADQGFDQISVEPVVTDPKCEYALREEDLPEIREEYERLAQIYMDRRANGKWFNFFHFMVDLEGGPCLRKRLTGCGAGNEYVAVTPDGDIYPCHQFVGRDGYRMGSVLDGTFDRNIQAKFAHNTVLNKEKCRDCWARFFCSGGCAANAEAFHGDISQCTSIWNEMLFALVLGGYDSKPATIALNELAGTMAAEFNVQMAGSLILALPVLVLYIFMGKYLISGQMSGAVTAS